VGDYQKKQFRCEKMIQGLKEGYFFTHSDHEHSISVTCTKNIYTYDFGCTAFGITKECLDEDEFRNYLLHEAEYLDHLRESLEGYLAHRGLIKLKEGDLDAAKTVFSEAIEMGFDRALTGLFLVSADKKENEQGSAILLQIHELDRQKQLQFYEWKGTCYRFLMNSNRAYQQLNLTTNQNGGRINKPNWERYYQRGYEDMVWYWTLILQIAPTDTQALFWRGQAYNDLEETTAALHDYQALLPLLSDEYYTPLKKCVLEEIEKIQQQ